jgi:hypothetical protein
MYSLSKDAEYQHALAESNCVGELQERSIVVTIDLTADSQSE